MPLSPPVERTHLHTRTIDIKGYERADGLVDIEAHLTDVKTYSFDVEHRGHVEPGTPLHGMWVRLTVDEHFVIVGSEASTDHGPYQACGGGAATYARLVGLKIQPGFLKEANARMAGPSGCTHLREMLQEIATTAFQTIWPARSRRLREAEAKRERSEESARRIVNSCHAYAADGEEVRKRWPGLYTGEALAEAGSTAD